MPSKQHRGGFILDKLKILIADFLFTMLEPFLQQKLTARECYTKPKDLIRENRQDTLNGVSNDHEASGKNGWEDNRRFETGATRQREGSSRESKKDYLHFLYIARGSLSETQYFIHLSRRLGYLPDADAERLIGQTRQTFACLHGLIKAVEKEAGKFAKTVAVLTSLLVLGLVSRGHLSVVSRL